MSLHQKIEIYDAYQSHYKIMGGNIDIFLPLHSTPKQNLK
jgi:hypothetical protein